MTSLPLWQLIQDHIEEPSLAIILLPSRIPSVLPNHTLYLPLISHPFLDLPSSLAGASSAFSEQVVSDSAQYSWDQLDIPREKILILRNERSDVVLDETQLEHLDSVVVAKAFAGLLSKGGKLSQRNGSGLFASTRRYANGL